MEYKTGDTLCGCRLLKKCGEGAYGTVFLAEDSIGSKVAVKIIHKSGRISDREITGLQNYRRCCNHRNLLKIGPISSDDSSYFYTMDAADDLNCGKGEYLPDTLANRLFKFGRMDGKDILAMLDGLLSGLEELHSKGLVHRDIKPDNILWVKGNPTLADAGLISQEGEGTIVGTPGFMSADLFNGKRKAEASDDFFALAKVIYCAYTGNPVEKYPNFPKDMTISTDTNLGRAYREPCNNPIHSSAEFRTLLAEKAPAAENHDETRKLNKILIIQAIIAIVMIAGIGLMWLNSRQTEAQKKQPARQAVQQQTEKQPAGQAVQQQTEKQPARQNDRLPQTAAESQKKITPKAIGLQNPEYAADLQKRVLDFLKGIGYFKENRLNSLLNYRTLSNTEIRQRLEYGNETPRLHTNGAPRLGHKIRISQTETLLLMRFNDGSNPPIDLIKLRQRQEYWRKQPGTPLEVQKKMLENDIVMQTAALDQFIRNAVNVLLKLDRFNADDEKNLDSIIFMRMELIKPTIGYAIYIKRKNNQ